MQMKLLMKMQIKDNKKLIEDVHFNNKNIINLNTDAEEENNH